VTAGGNVELSIPAREKGDSAMLRRVSPKRNLGNSVGGKGGRKG